MTKRDQHEISIYRQTIALIKRGYEEGHVERHHTTTFDMDCHACQSMVVIGFLESTIDLIKTVQLK